MSLINLISFVLSTYLLLIFFIGWIKNFRSSEIPTLVGWVGSANASFVQCRHLKPTDVPILPIRTLLISFVLCATFVYILSERLNFLSSRELKLENSVTSPVLRAVRFIRFVYLRITVT